MSLNPEIILEEFKKSGELERLRADLLSRFRSNEAYVPLKAKIDGIVQDRMQDDFMHYLPPNLTVEELERDVTRHPIVEKAIEESKLFSDQSLTTAIRSALEKIVKEKAPTAAPKGATREEITASEGIDSIVHKPDIDSKQEITEDHMDVDSTAT